MEYLPTFIIDLSQYSIFGSSGGLIIEIHVEKVVPTKPLVVRLVA